MRRSRKIVRDAMRWTDLIEAVTTLAKRAPSGDAIRLDVPTHDDPPAWVRTEIANRLHEIHPDLTVAYHPVWRREEGRRNA